MVSGIAGELYCRLVFNLSNGASFSFNTADTINENNFLTSIKLDERLSENSYLPVGINTSNVLDIEGTSKNHALIPDNDDSVYYGYMNNTCYIDLYITENEVEHYFGRFYVDSWKSSITNSTPNKFIISASNLMSTIGKCAVPDVAITSGMLIKDYVENVIESLNSQLDANKQIHYRSGDIDFSNFPTMYFCNIDTDNVDNCFNGISQATLTNIFIDRDGYLKTDYCLDDTAQEADYYVDVLVSSQVGTGSLVNYNGVKLNYTLGDIKDSEVIASVYDHTLTTSDNAINDISLGDAVYKINRIEVIPDEDGVFVGISSASYNKNKISLDFDIDRTIKVSVNIYGQRLDNTLLIKETGGDNKLEITNKIITSDLTTKYIDSIEKLIELKTNSMEIEAYIKPDINISDIIYVNAIGAMSVSGYYKVQGISWNLGQYGKCTISLIKTFEDEVLTEAEISQALNSQLTILKNSAETYTNVDPTTLVDITSQQNSEYLKNTSVYNSTNELYNAVLGGY